MKKDYLSLAINKLKPGAEFTYKNRDYNTIEWHQLDGDAPAQAKIDAAIEEVEADEAQAELAKAAKKASAEAKLAALGLDADDLRALGL